MTKHEFDQQEGCHTGNQSCEKKGINLDNLQQQKGKPNHLVTIEETKRNYLIWDKEAHTSSSMPRSPRGRIISNYHSNRKVAPGASSPNFQSRTRV